MVKGNDGKSLRRRTQFHIGLGIGLVILCLVFFLPATARVKRKRFKHDIRMSSFGLSPKDKFR